ncbi:MAG TPA: tetratricopeptide repeat protein, partial [Anaerolineales bacterium]
GLLFVLLSLLSGTSSQPCHTQFNQGVQSYNAGLTEAAIASFTQAAECFNARGSFSETAQACKLVGQCYRKLGQTEQALVFFKQALDYFTSGQLADPAEEADIRSSMAWTHYSAGAFEPAIREFEAAIAICRKHADPTGEAECEKGLGTAKQAAEDYEEAHAHFNRAAQIYVNLRQPTDATECLYHAGTSQYQLGQYRAAIAAFQRALSEGATARIAAHTQLQLGNCYLALERFPEAIAVFEAARQLLLQVDDAAAAIACTHNMAQSHLRLEQWQLAIGELQEVTNHYRDNGNFEDLQPALTSLGHANFNSGKYAEACGHYREAASVAQRFGWRPAEARALRNLGDALVASEDLPEAVEQLGAAASLFALLGETKEAFDTYAKVGEVNAAAGRSEESIAAYREALNLTEGVDSLAVAGNSVRVKLAEALRKAGRSDEVLRIFELAPDTQPAGLDAPDEVTAQALFGRGQANLDLDRNVEAAALFEAAAHGYLLSGQKANAGSAHYNAGLAHKRSDNPAGS